MAIFAIGDLHLSFNTDKPMNVFGDNWQNYEEKIKIDWISKVTDNDLVILPGDFSWATYLEEAKADFEFLNGLPGKKLLLKGNHDYWWTTTKKMRDFIKENNFINIDFIHNNSYEFENYIISGTRGWALIGEEYDARLVNRELLRLEMSIQDGIKKYGNDKEIIVCMHYPPITKNSENKEFIKVMQKYNIKQCIYGHLHAGAINDAIEGNIEDINYKLVSADALDFRLLKLK